MEREASNQQDGDAQAAPVEDVNEMTEFADDEREKDGEESSGMAAGEKGSLLRKVYRLKERRRKHVVAVLTLPLVEPQERLERKE